MVIIQLFSLLLINTSWSGYPANSNSFFWEKLYTQRKDAHLRYFLHTSLVIVIDLQVDMASRLFNHILSSRNLKQIDHFGIKLIN